MHMSTALKKGLVFGIGGCLFVVGIVLGGCWKLIFDKILFDQLALTDSSTSYDNWIEVPIPIYMEFHMFDWVNHECFDPATAAKAAADGMDCSKPEFQEKGPYVFKEEHRRTNLTWNSNNDTVTYWQVRTWHFDQSLSNGSLTDSITTVNPVAVSAAYFARYNNWLVKTVIDGFITNLESISITRTVGEFLFDGYDDELIDIIQDLGIQAFSVPFRKFGWFSERNGSYTYDGVFNMHTGADDVEKLGIIYSWNYEHQTHYYKSYCAIVNGTSGELGPPIDSDSQSYGVFVPDFCATFNLKRDGDQDVEGVTGSKFKADGEIFDNGTYTPDNACFSVGDKVPCGNMNVSLCKWNAPAFISFPHFYLADDYYLNAVKGLKPDKSKHEFTMVIEPNSGVPLQARARLQVNLLLQPFDDIKMFKNVPKVFMPIFWFTQKVDITSDLADMVKMVVVAPAAGWGALFGIAGIGALILIVGLVITVRHGWSSEDRSGLVK